MLNWPVILDEIFRLSGIRADTRCINEVSGGCISSSFIIHGLRPLFVKTNRENLLSMFEAEAAGLNHLARSDSVSVPQVICTGVAAQTSFIAMQAIEICTPQGGSYRSFGAQLAAMHRFQQPQYGSEMDNTIGSTAQINTLCDNWFDFWRENRLTYQLQLARKNGAANTLIDMGLELGGRMEDLFDHMPAAACLHGDLWQGNWAFDEKGRAHIFDPAHYFGDRETDIAMTRLFGAAPADFYDAYQHAYPLSDNYKIRETYYNIYHILNHYNLFGGMYLNQAQNMIQSVLSELR